MTATVGTGLVPAGGGLAFVTTAGDPGQARADLADKSFFADITTVQPNVKAQPQNDASTGMPTIGRGANQNGQEAGRSEVGSFPEEEHDPGTDHDDFAHVMSNQVMNRPVNCNHTVKNCNE